MFEVGFRLSASRADSSLAKCLINVVMVAVLEIAFHLLKNLIEMIELFFSFEE